MALAESNHHTAPRRQMTARAGGVEREENYEPRLLDPPLSQTAATISYVAAAGPLLVVPSLAGGDSVDGTALRFLLKQTLALQEGGGGGGGEEEEERVGRRGQERARVLGACSALPRPCRLEEEEEKEEEEKTSSCSSASTRLSTSL